MSLTARNGAPARDAATTPLPLVVSGVIGGVAGGILSYLALAVIALGAWMLDPGGTQEWSQMLEAASGAWLAGMGLPPTVDGVTVTLLPFGFALMPLLGLIAAGRWSVEASAVARPGEALTVASAAAVGFAGVAAVIAALARSLSVPPTQAALVCGAFALVVMGVTVLIRARLLAWTRVPASVRDAAVAAAAALATVVCVSSVLVAVSVIGSLDSINALLVELDPGLSGAVLLTVLTLGYLPNAIVWAMAYVIGPGITLAAGTSLSAFSEPSSAALPGFPLLAALPGEVPAAAVALPGAVVGAGVFAGLLLRRRGHGGLEGLACGAIASVLTGALMAFLGWLASGSLGTTTLQGLGPAPLSIGVIGGALVGVGALVVVAWPTRYGDG